MRSLFFIIATLATLAGLTAARAANGIEGGLKAYHAENYAEALRILEPLAQGGDARAQHWLGVMYDSGKGVSKDPAAGTSWFMRAARQGFAEAQFHLGMKFLNGYGAPWSPGQGRWWIRQAANQGHLDALHFLVNSGECGQC